MIYLTVVMSEHKNELPNPLDLPAPNNIENDALSDSPPKELGSSRNPEFLKQVGDEGGHKNPAVSIQPPQAQVSDDQSGSVNDSSVKITHSTPQIADDIDLIEKEWVEKAKEIVEKTRENPYLQNKAISEIKSDYIKKRYNKDLAKSEE